jgi:hypothetical protein
VTSRGKKLIAEAAGVFGTLVAWGLGVAWGVDARFSPQRVPSGLFCFFIGTEGRWPPGGGAPRANDGENQGLHKNKKQNEITQVTNNN